MFFVTEKLNVTIVSHDIGASGLLSVEEEKSVREAQLQHKDLLKIPRRSVTASFLNINKSGLMMCISINKSGLMMCIS